jgi:hypothetical protein
MITEKDIITINEAKAYLERYKETLSKLPADLISIYADKLGYFNAISYQALNNQIDLLTDIIQSELKQS